MTSHPDRTTILRFAIAGFAIGALGAYALLATEFLASTHFEGLYDLPASEQTLSRWLSLHEGFVFWYAGAGILGAAISAGTRCLFEIVRRGRAV